MLQRLLFITVLFVFTGCAGMGYEITKDMFVIKPKGKEIRLSLQNRRSFSVPCVAQSFTADTPGQGRLEYVRLRRECTYNGRPGSLYRGLLPKYFDNLRVIRDCSTSSHELVLYESSGGRFYFISGFTPQSNFFLLDKSGAAKRINPECEAIAPAERIAKLPAFSLVRQSLSRDFFSSQTDELWLFN